MQSKFRVLVSDQLSESGLVPLYEAQNIEVEVKTDLSPEELIAEIPAYHALVVRSSTQVTAEVLQAGRKLQVVARAGVGVDNIDLPAATSAGVIVVNAPTGNVVAAAEHTIAMLMSMARLIPQADHHVRQGQWKRGTFMGVEVRGKILGTVGLGRVAQEVVDRAKGLGMQVLAHDPYVTAEYAAQRGVMLADLETLFRQSDFITFHVPMTDTTRHMISHNQFRMMKPGVRILNVARGGVVDEAALVEAIQNGKVAGAALDVFEEEPLPADSPLRNLPQVVLTPHLGGSTVEAQEKVAVDVALQVIDVLEGRPARYAVNAPILPPRALDVLIPYIDLAERMGHFLRQLDGQGIDRLEVTAQGSIADYDLDYIVAAAIKGILANVVEDRVNLVNARLLAERRGMEVMERKSHHHHHERYEDMLTVRMSSGGVQRTVRGAMLHGIATLVAIDDLWVEFPAEGHLLLTSHRDRPGIIGRIGTLLGQRDVNISFMHVGRRAPRGEAIMVLGTDEAIPADLEQEMSKVDGVSWRKAVWL
jgi:D-3-phosphoglycerate dehydrogenase